MHNSKQLKKTIFQFVSNSVLLLRANVITRPSRLMTHANTIWRALGGSLANNSDIID